MSIAVITGAAGLIGSEAAMYFAQRGLSIVGIDNDMRQVFFGREASTAWNQERLKSILGKDYVHNSVDIRDSESIGKIFRHYGNSISLVIHAAAQPSHDWAARQPIIDFSINANGTLTLLEAVRSNCPDAVFIFTSTNKVYGDAPNLLPLNELENRWEIRPGHEFENGITEQLSIDQSLHSLFGVSKVAADLAVQEYGRYFGLQTVCFRCGCLSGPNHAGTELHGFLSFLVKSAVCRTPYIVHGHKAKQVRDNIHSLDLVRAFDEFFKAPRIGEVYNIGGGRSSNCSMIEAIKLAEQLVDCELNWTMQEKNRIGDHIWWISSNSKFQNHYPSWGITKFTPQIMREIFEFNYDRWIA